MALSKEQELFYIDALSQYKTRLISTILGISYRKAGEIIQEDWKTVNSIMMSEKLRLGDEAFRKQQNQLFNEATQNVSSKRAVRLARVMSSGKELSDQAAKYLESQGFEHGDFGFYCLSEEGWEDCGIIRLGHWGNEVVINVVSPHFGNQSPDIRIGGDFQKVKDILDVLIFTIKMGAKE